MQKLISLIAKVTIYSLSILPFYILHRLSDILYLLLRFVIKYRKKVIDSNLDYCFPEKSKQEKLAIKNQFYRHFADIIIESIKLFSISKKELYKRHKIVNPEIFHKYAEQGKSIIILGAHYANWEWYNLSLAQLQKNELPKVMVLYRTLKNSNFNELIFKSRSRTGSLLIDKNKIFRVLAKFDKQFVLCLAADQAPRKMDKTAYFMEFMNMNTSVFFGPEKLSKLFDLPLIYVKTRKVKRSYYEITLEEICAHPKEETHGEITEKFMKKLERDIREAPPYWLWSHKRWKLNGY